MPTPEEKDKKPEVMVEVPQATLETIQKKMLEMEREIEDQKGANAGLKEMLEAQGKDGGGETKLREKKSYEPKFRTVRLRKYPVAGKYEDQDYVIGWTARGAYREVDRTGISPEIVDYIDVIFLRNKDKKIAEKIRLLSLLNEGVQEHCKILEVKKHNDKVPTGEEIDVTTWDPQHGLIATGEKVDGYTMFSDDNYVIQIPGHPEPITINEKFINS